jgi:hypothetical protein
MRFAVVDANSIAEFQKERISTVPSHGVAAITHILKTGCIAVDNGGLIIQEWKDTCGGASELSLSTWIAGRLVDGNIKLIPVKKGNYPFDKAVSTNG